MADGPWAGWYRWPDPIEGTFLEPLGLSYFRSDAPGKATVMLESLPTHVNRLGALHGGFLATLADHAYFAGLAAMDRPEQVAAVTVDLTMQFCGAGSVGPPVRTEVEVLRETGRLLFMRLTMEQDGNLIAASTATIRKASAPK
ncbi:uncharacterized domain 1-containing protein [Sphingobium faniae]|nr:uncharacterized domain 1-containing protein [Sphingobium faniae]